jgi:hypothetical protein
LGAGQALSCDFSPACITLWKAVYRRHVGGWRALAPFGRNFDSAHRPFIVMGESVAGSRPIAVVPGSRHGGCCCHPVSH